jgi:hypothetical protein
MRRWLSTSMLRCRRLSGAAPHLGKARGRGIGLLAHSLETNGRLGHAEVVSARCRHSARIVSSSGGVYGPATARDRNVASAGPHDELIRKEPTPRMRLRGTFSERDTA